ncbi:MAG: DMT family transporter [Rhodocyclales bacterium]|nr:DMT family transporter [Rhodocyclales bacterium]
MNLVLAYLGIILIWATTPLAVQWSTQGVDFAWAVFLRMAIGLVVAGLLVVLARIPFPFHARARRAYLVGGVGMFGGMILTYWGACRIHSGLISVLFGLSPLMAGVMAWRWLGEPPPGAAKLGGILLALGGLGLIFLQGNLGDATALSGLLAVLLAAVVYSATLIGLKKIADDSPPLATTLGTLAVALPLFGLACVAGGGAWPSGAPLRSWLAIGYLGVFGSVIGFALYYYVIRHLPTARVALITLITPVLALMLGHAFNGEALGLRLVAGAGLVLLGLGLHQRDSWWRPARR